MKVKILPPVSFDELYALDNKEFSSAAANSVRESLILAVEHAENAVKKRKKK